MWQSVHGLIGGTIDTYLNGHNEKLKQLPLRITGVGTEIGTRDLKMMRNV